MQKRSFQIKNIITCIKMIDTSEFMNGVLPDVAVEKLKKKCIVDIVDYGIDMALFYMISNNTPIAFPLFNKYWYESAFFKCCPDKGK